MKTAIFRIARYVLGPMARARQPWRALLIGGALAAANSVSAQPAVETLGGGPSQSSPPYWGFMNGDTKVSAQFHSPWGLATDSTGNLLFVADRDNNVVRKLNLPGNLTSTFASSSTNKLNQPVGVAVDGAGSVYVLNRGNGNNGTLLKFSAAGSFVSTNATGLANATALAIDGITNLFVTVNGNTVIRVTPSKVVTTIATLTNAGVQLQGIAVLDGGTLAVSDSGNHGLWLIDPFTGNWWPLAGFNGAGDMFGPGDEAQFNQPAGLATAGDGYLVVADRGNHRVKVVDTWFGDVTKLYGVSSSLWYTGTGAYPGWWDATVSALESEAVGSEEAREPVAVVVAPGGEVYATEVYYHLIRKVTDSGLPVPGSPGVVPQFNTPTGLALDSAGNFLFVADQANNTVFRLGLADNLTVTFVTANMNSPVAVAVDGADNVFVLNEGTGNDGSILKFNKFGNLLATNVTGLAFPTALTLNNSGTLFVSERDGAVKSFGATGSNDVITTIAGAGVRLEGIAMFNDGTLVVSDAGRHVLWQIDLVSGGVSLLTGIENTPGTTIGTKGFAQLNQPRHLARAAGDKLLVADSGNNRLVVVDRGGTLTEAASTSSQVWFGRAGDPVAMDDTRFVSMVLPVGVVVGEGGAAFSSETLYHNLRKTEGVGLERAGLGGGGGSGTNIVVEPPAITPDFGYYPMGQQIAVRSPNPDVFYTIDGTVPTTNSLRVAMNNNSGTIRWNNSLKDLSWLRVRAFFGTNASTVVSGQASPTNSIGVPTGLNGQLYAGIGSTVVIPVVANLRTNDRVRSLQFRVEVTPDTTSAINISDQFRALSILTNDFVPVVTASPGATTAVFSATSYTLPAGGGRTNRGLYITAIGNNANMVFSNYAVVAMLAVPIPPNASEGQTYSVNVLEATATSDGVQTPVTLPAMNPATILVTNAAYTVGDSSPGAWYDAGTFGNGDLNNADVNNAFYASLGLRVPYPFTDAYNAMDTFPVDRPGRVGGDGFIRFQDWQLVLQRSLRLNTNNWKRQWQPGGYLTNNATSLARYSTTRPALNAVVGGWYRNALIGAIPVGDAIPNLSVDVPIYAKIAAGSSLAGLQFRACVTPEGAAPPVTQNAQFLAADGVNAPDYQIPMVSGIACAWNLPQAGEQPKLNLTSQSSNLLGYVRFVVPLNAAYGQSYVVEFLNADGAPDANTESTFETRQAQVRVLASATPARICSDEWQTAFFGGVGAAASDDLADGDHDGMPNWQEFIAGTDPLVWASKLEFTRAQPQINGSQKLVVLRWQTVPGRVYEVRSAVTPNASGWNWRANTLGDGNEAVFVETNAAGGAQYYRLLVQP